MNRRGDSFSKFIYLSICLHVVVFVALTVKFVFFTPANMAYQKSVRVDVVALPDKITPNLPTSAPKPIAKKEKKPKPIKKKKKKAKPKSVVKKTKKKAPKKKVNLNPKKVADEQDSAIARLKALQKLKANKAKAPEFKGNAISKGNSLVGLEKLHHESYLEELDNHIRSYWNLPEWLADGNLKASIVILINKNGGISKKTFTLKSGNSLFDEQVLNTLEKASPLPPPPPSLINFYQSTGVDIRFP